MLTRSGQMRTVFLFFNNRLGCIGSLVLSAILTVLVIVATRGCLSH